MGMRQALAWTATLCVALGVTACGGDDPAGDAPGSAGAAGSGGAAGTAACDAPPEPTGDAKFDAVAKYFFDEARAQNVPGGAIVVYDKGTLRRMVYGSKSRATCDPIGLQTRFNAGRIGYSLTALAAVRASLEPESPLDLDAPITTWMPDFEAHLGDSISKARAPGITLRRLLSFNSGYWPGFFGPPGPWPTDQVPPEARHANPEGLADFFQHAQGQIRHEPGRMSMPSDPSFALAARVLELASGGTLFPELMRSRFSEPSGLGITWNQTEAFDGDFAGASTTGKDPVMCAALWSTWGAYASTEDLGKLVQSLVTGGGDGVLSAAEVEAFFGNVGTSDDVAPTVGVRAGLAMFRMPFPPYGTLAYRQGYWGGPSIFLIVPEQQFAFASLQA
jgi:CubicO group peptidase (beta-lactamase class C family)